MSGYHYTKVIHNSVSIQQGEPGQVIVLPAYSTLIYRLAVLSFAVIDMSILVRVSAVDAPGHVYTLGATPSVSAPSNMSLICTALFGQVRLDWVITPAAQNVLMYDDIEVIG